MGNEIGVYTDDDLKDLTPEQHEHLRRHTLHLLQNSQEVRDIIEKNPKLVTTDKSINAALRKVLDPRLDRLKRNLPPE
jgi:hypothetical protein